MISQASSLHWSASSKKKSLVMHTLSISPLFTLYLSATIFAQWVVETSFCTVNISAVLLTQGIQIIHITIQASLVTLSATMPRIPDIMHMPSSLYSCRDAVRCIKVIALLIQPGDLEHDRANAVVVAVDRHARYLYPIASFIIHMEQGEHILIDGLPRLVAKALWLCKIGIEHLPDLMCGTSAGHTVPRASSSPNIVLMTSILHFFIYITCHS